MQHLIRTQIIEVETDQPAGAFNLQHTASALFYRYILPLLEEIFDELSPSATITRIDRLEINLGSMTEQEMQRSDWSVKFREKIYRQLKEALLVHQLQARAPESIQNIAGQWLYYMQHGYLPWNLLQTTAEWYNKALEIFASDHRSITLLRKLIKEHPKAVKRIVLLHDLNFRIHLAEVLTASNQAELAPVLEALQIIILREEGQRQWQQFENEAWEQILLYVATTERQLSSDEIIRQAALPALSRNSLKRLVAIKNRAPALEPFSTIIEKLLVIKEANTSEKNLNLLKEEPYPSKKEGLPEEGLFIKFAGLVILHPFLNRFFTRVRYSENGKFRTREDQCKAILLLHYLGCGKIEFEEHELVMQKTLCGYPLADPIEPVALSQEALAEADSLLESVITEWPILKNTSPAGLQESFLQRSGKLATLKNGDTRLVVEANAVDVLLDHLPWSLSMIKLPWMSQILKVEWK